MAREIKVREGVDLDTAPERGKKRNRAFLLEGARASLEEEAQLRYGDGIAELDPSLIDVGGPADRMMGDHRTEPQKDLVESIRSQGQQIPCVVRRKPGDKVRYESIFGNRRIEACREIGIKVKAIIRDATDEELVRAKGIENNVRQDLTFIEKVRFAQQLADLKFNYGVIAEALGVTSKSLMSEMLKIGRDIPDSVIEAIGAAPGVGRPRWTALATVMKAVDGSQNLSMKALKGPLSGGSSDQKFNSVLKLLSEDRNAGVEKAESSNKQSRQVFAAANITAEMKATKNGVDLMIRDTKSSGFANWLSNAIPEAMKELHDRYQKEIGAKK